MYIRAWCVKYIYYDIMSSKTGKKKQIKIIQL